MEVFGFSFLNQQEDNNINSYGLYQEMDDDNANNSKQRRTDFDTSSESSDKAPSFNDILATYTPDNWALDSDFDSFNHINIHDKPLPSHDYVENSHASSSDFRDKKNKRSRREIPESSSSGQQQQQRRLWVKNRSNAWWEQCNSPDFPEDEFRKAFRMSKSTFELICSELDSAVMKKNTMLRLAIPVRQRVAVCIWRLATGEPLRLVSKRFGLGISTCHKLVLEVCSAIKTVLMPKFLQWPDETKMDEIRSEFESISGIPNVCGSIYTTHVPIIAPKISVAAYFNKRHTERNQKTSYSITVQGLIDPKGVFTDVCIGWPGSMPDDKILEKSALLQRANNGALKDQWVVGNSSYPLMDWLLVPYGHPNITWTQHAFNDKIAKVQEVAKAAFGRLKGRWSCLQKRTEVKLMDLPVLLGACCVLHNICEMRGETIEPELNVEVFDDEMVPEIPLRSASSMQARDQFAHNLLHRNHAASHLFPVGH